jgi:fibronectin-binding autotransporter adhesin
LGRQILDTRIEEEETRRTNREWFLLATATALMWAAPVAVVQAQTILTWGATGGGGTGTWDTSHANWFNGSAAVPWTQGSSAIFAGTAGTLTVGAPITVQNMTFSTDGYTITGNTLTVSGTTATITTGTDISATISSALTGSARIVKTGGGALTLTNPANSWTGAQPFRRVPLFLVQLEHPPAP